MPPKPRWIRTRLPGDDAEQAMRRLEGLVSEPGLTYDKYDARNPGVKPYGKYGWSDSDLEREERERRNADSGSFGRQGDDSRPSFKQRFLKGKK